MTEKLVERRAIQRDWLGHGIQVLLIVVTLGLPLLYWGSGVNIAIAKLEQKTERQEKDITHEEDVRTIITNQIIDANKQLTRIETLLDHSKK